MDFKLFSAGQERFAKMTQNFTRGSDGLIVVYDVTCRKSLEIAKQLIEDHKQEHMEIMLLGNKIDYIDARCVSTEEGFNTASALDALFLEVGALTGENVEKAFDQMVERIFRNEVYQKIREREKMERIEFSEWVLFKRMYKHHPSAVFNLNSYKYLENSNNFKKCQKLVALVPLR